MSSCDPIIWQVPSHQRSKSIVTYLMYKGLVIEIHSFINKLHKYLTTRTIDYRQTCDITELLGVPLYLTQASLYDKCLLE